MGYAGRHVFWDRTSAAWAGNLGIGRNGIAMGCTRPRSDSSATHSGCIDPGSAGHADWYSGSNAGRPRLWLKDPQFVVIDEVAGQLVALIAVPLAWKSFLAAFILFRVFDILKPPPVRQLEALPEGTGIVLDDIAAGLYALFVVHLFLRFGLLR